MYQVDKPMMPFLVPVLLKLVKDLLARFVHQDVVEYFKVCNTPVDSILQPAYTKFPLYCIVCSRVPSVADDDDGVDNVSSLRDTASSEQRLPSVATVTASSSVFLTLHSSRSRPLINHFQCGHGYHSPGKP